MDSWIKGGIIGGVLGIIAGLLSVKFSFLPLSSADTLTITIIAGFSIGFLISWLFSREAGQENRELLKPEEEFLLDKVEEKVLGE